MIIPDEIADQVINLKDQFFDLRGLSVYSSLGVSTLRDYIKRDGMPSFKVGGKVLVKMSEFNEWMEGYRQNRARDLDALVDDIMADTKAWSD